jgi:cytoskeletal protein CcmA (bactofilin family)
MHPGKLRHVKVTQKRVPPTSTFYPRNVLDRFFAYLAPGVLGEEVSQTALPERRKAKVWNKRTDEPQVEPIRTSMPPAVASPEPAPRGAPAPPRQAATIGASMNIKGEIRTREELYVDGEVEGLVESHSLLTVGPNGKVKANIKAREVIVYGSVRGNVDVTEKIAIRDKGSVIGDIKTAGIGIDDGAYFKGSIDIIRPEPKVSTKPVKSDAPVAVAAG